ncbi:transposase [Lacticaseibacillus paracasei]|nr:transposase [Lacticaseibacillus paracasei]MBU6045888.1 transposase [Lacticaseibacillus paracasei]
MTNSPVGFPQFYQIQQILDRFSKMDAILSGRGAKAALLTVADRDTRLLATTKLDNLSQSAVLKGFSRLIADSLGPVRTVTIDHDKEFSCD